MFIPSFFPAGFLGAIHLARTLFTQLCIWGFGWTSSSGPFRPKNGKNFSLWPAKGTALSLVVSLYSAHMLENSPFITLSLSCPNMTYRVFLGTLPCIHFIPVLTPNRGSEQYLRGTNSIVSKLVILIYFFYTFILLLLSSHLISHGRTVTLFRFF